MQLNFFKMRYTAHIGFALSCLLLGFTIMEAVESRRLSRRVKAMEEWMEAHHKAVIGDTSNFWQQDGGGIDRLYLDSNGIIIPPGGKMTFSYELKLDSIPRKDTVDWPYWFRRVYGDPDTVSKMGNTTIHFDYFVGGYFDGGKWVDVVTIDGKGKLHVKDSLAAIQHLIKNALLTTEYINQLKEDHEKAINNSGIITAVSRGVQPNCCNAKQGRQADKNSYH